MDLTSCDTHACMKHTQEVSLSENGPEDGIVFFQFCAVRSVDIGVLYIDVLKYVNDVGYITSYDNTRYDRIIVF